MDKRSEQAGGMTAERIACIRKHGMATGEFDEILDALESARAQVAELEAEHERVLAYARKVAHSRDVHSVYEVLDKVTALEDAGRPFAAIGRSHAAQRVSGPDKYGPQRLVWHDNCSFLTPDGSCLTWGQCRALAALIPPKEEPHE